MSIRSPIQWYDGKQAMVPKLLPLFPPHHSYIEAFGGGGSLLLSKTPSPIEIYNDLDSDVVNFFRVVRDRKQMFADLYNRACLSPLSREEYNFCRDHLNDDPDPVERARRFFVLARYSFGGIIGNSFGLNVKASTRGMAEKASAFRSALCLLPAISDRLMCVQIENKDFRSLIPQYDHPEAFFYLDPPYVPSTRRSGGYRYEMTEEDHKDLVALLQNIQGKVMLSGYRNELYDALGWNRLEWETTCRAAGRTRASGLQGTGAVMAKQKRIECAWLNYEPPQATRP